VVTLHSTVVDLRRAGRFEAVRAVLSEERSAWASLERARCALTLGEPANAEADIAFALAHGTPHERAFAAALAAMNGGPVPSLLELAAAGPYVDDAVYYAALARYRGGDGAGARSLIDAHQPASECERARHLLLRGAAKSADDDYAGQSGDANEALTILLSVQPEETYLIAFASWIIAALARELPNLPDVEHLARIEQRLHWIPELNHFRFQLLRTLGWRASITGRAEDALTHFARAGFYATTQQLCAFAHLDRAESAAAVGEHFSAAVERTIAIETLDAIDWSGVTDESIAVLATAARVLAGGAYPQALRYAELAEHLIEQMDGRWSFAHGPRMRAFINEGISFAVAASNPSRAVDAGRSAYDVFSAIGYVWRAIRVADHLYSLTGNQVWRERAATLAKLYPQGVLLNRRARPLTPRQAEIAKRLCGNETIEEIAGRLGVSPSTVKTIAQRVYARTGARDRRDLRNALRVG
jgi:DNA-binding CsgD family transcriptional regulator